MLSVTPTPELFPRYIAARLREAIDSFRVVVVNGPRQAGKSTLLRALAPANCPVLTLDDRDQLRAARTDPAGFVAAYSRPTFIDEVQRGGNSLILAIKAEVDRHHTESGLFVLAGSSRFLTVPQLSESLAGRVRLAELLPLSQGELTGTGSRPHFLTSLMADPDAIRSLDAPRLNRPEAMERVIIGGFPAVHRLSSARLRSDWFDSYVETLVQRDLLELSRIRQSTDLPRLLRLLAARSAQELNLAKLARHAGLGEDATRAYLALLETIYLHYSLPAWSTNETSRAKRRPKLHFVDTGVAANLLGATVDQLAIPTAPLAGPLLESFVASELRKSAAWSEERVVFNHYRDAEKREVDLVVEARDGRVGAIEVKAARDVDESDFRHLRYLRDRLGDRFVNGVVVHLGERPLSFGDRLTALPLAAIWA